MDQEAESHKGAAYMFSVPQHHWDALGFGGDAAACTDGLELGHAGESASYAADDPYQPAGKPNVVDPLADGQNQSLHAVSPVLDGEERDDAPADVPSSGQ